MAYTDMPHGTLLPWLKAQYEGKVVEGSRSSAGNWLGFTLDRIETGKAVITVPIRHDMTNGYGNIHGGMMALLIDEVIGWAVLSLESEQHYTSVSLNIDFLYAVKELEFVTAEANIIRHGKKVVFAACTVNDLKGNVLARASSNLVVTSMPIKNG